MNKEQLQTDCSQGGYHAANILHCQDIRNADSNNNKIQLDWKWLEIHQK